MHDTPACSALAGCSGSSGGDSDYAAEEGAGCFEEWSLSDGRSESQSEDRLGGVAVRRCPPHVDLERMLDPRKCYARSSWNTFEGNRWMQLEGLLVGHHMSNNPRKLRYLRAKLSCFLRVVSYSGGRDGMRTYGAPTKTAYLR